MRLPTDVNLESQVLGIWIMIPASQYLIPNAKREFFSEPEFAMLFDTISEMYKDGLKIEMLTVNTKINNPSLLGRVANNVVSHANQEYYLRILEQFSKQRKFLHFCQKVSVSPEYWEKDFSELVKENTDVMNEIMDLRSWSVSKMSQVTTVTIENLDVQDIDNPSGWFRLDKLIGGFKKQDMILVGGRPAMGKTAFALCLAMAHEKMGGKPAFISLEMPKHAISTRRLSILSGVEAARIFNKTITSEEKELVKKANIRNPTNMLIDDTAGMDIYAIGSKIKQMVKHEYITSVFIDYIQLIKPLDNRASREQEVAKISTSLKQLARDCNICIIALAQLNRDVEKRTDRRPQLSDLRDSGQLEQDADVVLFPFRPEYYKKTEIEDNPVFENPENCEIIIAKNRNGKIGSLGSEQSKTLVFNPKTIEYIFA